MGWGEAGELRARAAVCWAWACWGRGHAAAAGGRVRARARAGAACWLAAGWHTHLSGHESANAACGAAVHDEAAVVKQVHGGLGDCGRQRGAGLVWVGACLPGGLGAWVHVLARRLMNATSHQVIRSLAILAGSHSTPQQPSRAACALTLCPAEVGPVDDGRAAEHHAVLDKGLARAQAQPGAGTGERGAARGAAAKGHAVVRAAIGVGGACRAGQGEGVLG